MWIGIFISLQHSGQFSFLGLISAFYKLHGASESFFKNTNDGTMVVDRHNIVFGVNFDCGNDGFLFVKMVFGKRDGHNQVFWADCIAFDDLTAAVSMLAALLFGLVGGENGKFEWFCFQSIATG